MSKSSSVRTETSSVISHFEYLNLEGKIIFFVFIYSINLNFLITSFYFLDFFLFLSF